MDQECHPLVAQVYDPGFDAIENEDYYKSFIMFDYTFALHSQTTVTGLTFALDS
jgi:hypothetical protein